MQAELLWSNCRLVDTVDFANDVVGRLRAAMPGDHVGFDVEFSGPGLPGGKMVNVYRAQLTGFSLAFQDGAAFYVPMNHTSGNLSYTACLDILQALGATKGRVWAHNWKNEMKVLKLANLPIPAKIGCSMLLMWVLNQPAKNTKRKFALKELVKTYFGVEMATYEETTKGLPFMALDPTGPACGYAADDAVYALRLATEFEPKLAKSGLEFVFYEIEMPNVEVFAHMEMSGIDIDRAKLMALGDEAYKQVAGALARWNKLFPDVKISSNQQLQTFFESGDWPSDLAERTKSKKAYKVDRDNLELILAHPETTERGREAIKTKLWYQDYAKILSTYSYSLIAWADEMPDGRLHPNMLQHGTRTGRPSCSDPNLYNIPVRTELGREVKACFVAGPGKVLVAADYGQIELRVLAHIARHGRLYEAFMAGRDPHSELAEKLNIPRDVAKTANFAPIYGSGWRKLSRTTGLSPAEAKQLLRDLREENYAEENLRTIIHAAAARRGYVKTATGRRRYTRHVGNKTHRKECRLDYDDCTLCQAISHDQRIAFNTPIQGFAADIMKLAQIAVYRELVVPGHAEMLVNVYDELLLRTTPDKVEFVGKRLQQCMEAAFELRVPLVAEWASADNWKDCKA